MLIISPPPETGAHGERRSSELVLDEGEVSLLQAKHYGTADKFTQALWELILIADADDLAKLAKVYPSHIAAYINYKRVPGWFDNLITRMPQRRTTDAT